MTFWPMICNISIAEKSQSAVLEYEAKLKAGTEVMVKETRHFNLLKKSKTRLVIAAKDARPLGEGERGAK